MPDAPPTGHLQHHPHHHQHHQHHCIVTTMPHHQQSIHSKAFTPSPTAAVLPQPCSIARATTILTPSHTSTTTPTTAVFTPSPLRQCSLHATPGCSTATVVTPSQTSNYHHHHHHDHRVPTHVPLRQCSQHATPRCSTTADLSQATGHL